MSEFRRFALRHRFITGLVAVGAIVQLVLLLKGLVI